MKQSPLVIGNLEIYWLNGGEFELDGGTMFGVVPKVLWEKKIPAGPDNYIRLANLLILVKGPNFNIVIETGLGNKLTDKQKMIFRVVRDWEVEDELLKVGLSRKDISHVVLTHCDFDHAGGIVMYNAAGELELTFPNAGHYIQQYEWEDVLTPNIRSSNTYWPVNFEQLQKSDKLELVSGEHEIVDGVRVSLTGGHTRGHQIVWIESEAEYAVHAGDLLPDHAHSNPLWITPFDNFPLDSISQKQGIFKKALEKNMWFLFYHDPILAACTFDDKGKVIKKWQPKSAG